MSVPRINLIYACARNGVIGRDNSLPWHLPEDMAHFKECTVGAPVIMGRKTWDSLPPKFRPLPERTNIVVTRYEQWEAEGALKASSIEEALQLVPQAPEVWVIGGAQIYEAALPLASRAYVTQIDETFEGDAYAPELIEGQWQEIQSTETLISTTGLKYRFVIYERTAPAEEEAPEAPQNTLSRSPQEEESQKA